MKWFAVLALPGLAFASFALRESGFEAGPGGTPSGWSTWSPRKEISPRTFIEKGRSRGDGGALGISGAGNPASTGGWERLVTNVVPQQWYQLTAFYRGTGLKHEANEIVCRLDWTDKAGGRAGQPDYAYQISRDGEWRKLTLTAPAPEKAAAAKIQLYLHNAPNATVVWDDISLEEVDAPKPRPVVIATVKHRPRNTSGPEESVERFIQTIEKSAPEKADVIVLPEGITVVGTSKKYPEVAEPIPGPTTKRLGEVARQRDSYIVAGIYEKDGALVYNTSVLIDRKGNPAGKYRKVYLPREEIEAGITAGNEYPVFDTDFAKVGMMICWDVQYADPARALALKGAELILMPIWGGNLTLTKARAIENQVFLVTSGYDIDSMILDPMGELMGTPVEDGVVTATVDLNRRYIWPWLGEMRGRFMKEVRLDVPMERPDYPAAASKQ
jgi:predicted amidohydrolase